jgi:hypothetical protein
MTLTPANDNYPVISAAAAIAQGSTPAVLFSVAKFNERAGRTHEAREARTVAREMAREMGVAVGGRQRGKRRAG